MDGTDEISNDQEMVMRALMSIVKRAQTRVDNQVGHFENAHHM
jgi:hypothetical protein